MVGSWLFDLFVFVRPSALFCKERLIYCALLVLRDDIETFKPNDADLDYPGKLRRALAKPAPPSSALSPAGGASDGGADGSASTAAGGGAADGLLGGLGDDGHESLYAAWYSAWHALTRSTEILAG